MNKHIKIALFIAPLLVFGAYFATDLWVVEKSNKGQNLALFGTCLPKENACLLQHGHFELKMISQKKKGQWQLAMVSNQPIEKISLAVAKPNGDFQSVALGKGDTSQYWQILLVEGDDLSQFNQFRLALQKDEQSLFAEGEWVM